MPQPKSPPLLGWYLGNNMEALKWTYPHFGSHGSALGFWKLDILHENLEILTNFQALIAGPFWPSKNSNLEMVIMSAFQPNLNQLNRITESKVMIEILISVQARIQIRFGLWIIPGFHLWSTSNRFRSPYLAAFNISWF